ncbi:MAG: Lrp/AsnC family transcriptional regulator [Akkermansia sp.]
MDLQPQSIWNGREIPLLHHTLTNNNIFWNQSNSLDFIQRKKKVCNVSLLPVSPIDPINTALLTVAEDRISGFHRLPFHTIAEQSGLDVHTVIDRLKALMEAGVVRRVRQTLLATKLAQGALVAWDIPEDRLNSAFEWLQHKDPFTGHVVLRTTDINNPGANYKLWTTLKVPIGCGTLDGHCTLLSSIIGASHYILLPAHGIFALSVGHLRRRSLKPGDKLPQPAPMSTTTKVELSSEEWDILLSLKEQLTLDEMVENPWQHRAASLGISLEHFYEIAEQLDQKKVIGRFATFLEHVKPQTDDGPITRFNGLFHWSVPHGMEQQAGAECGRHLCMTHCYWRTGGQAFGNAQIMGVVHGLEKEAVLAHKAAIDAHLTNCGIPILHTAVFWGIRSEIKPSEISPAIYHQWLASIRQIISF